MQFSADKARSKEGGNMEKKKKKKKSRGANDHGNARPNQRPGIVLCLPIIRALVCMPEFLSPKFRSSVIYYRWRILRAHVAQFWLVELRVDALTQAPSVGDRRDRNRDR